MLSQAEAPPDASVCLAAASTRNSDLRIEHSMFLLNSGSAVSVGVQAGQQAAVISFSHFVRNAALDNDGGAINAAGDRTGAAAGRRLELQLERCSFEGNVADRWGGAVATRSGVSIAARGCTFRANTDSVRQMAASANARTCSRLRFCRGASATRRERCT
jgi:hypothetical protein